MTATLHGHDLAHVLGHLDGDVPCTSRARHHCGRTARFACHGDGQTVTWCTTRHAAWRQDCADGVRCRECGEPQTHWTVVTL